MLRLSQQDPLWKDTKIGKSKSTIAGHGCLITALCMIWSKFHYTGSDYLRPDEASRAWTFTAVKDDSDPKYLLWSSISTGMKFVWRSWTWTPKELCPDPVTGEKGLMGDIVNKYTHHPDYGVVLRVKTKSGGQHWLACTGRSVLGWSANDPLGGKRRWALPYPYTSIDGFALIAKN